MNAYSPESTDIELTPEEIGEVDQHKYFLSENAGYDVGWEHALEDWLQNHRPSTDGDDFSADKRQGGLSSMFKRLFSKAAAL